MGSFIVVALFLGLFPQQKDLPQYPRAWAKARNAPLESPLTPSIHYRMQGVTAFNVEAQDGGQISQEADLWLGGPTRLRYTLRTEDVKNVFLLANQNDAWVSTPNSPNFKKYPSRELLLETWLRWIVLRWPWDWPEESEHHTEMNKMAIELPTPYGTANIFFASNHLPEKAILGPLTLYVKDWRKGTRAPLVPHSWEWQADNAVRTENFSQITGHILCLDSHFHPNESAAPTWTAFRASPNQAGHALTDWIGIVERRFVHAPLAHWQRSRLGGGDIEIWTQISQKGDVKDVGVAAQKIKGDWILDTGKKEWLCWSTYVDITSEQGATLLREAARQKKWAAIGPVWVSSTKADERARRKEFLVQVAMQANDLGG